VKGSLLDELVRHANSSVTLNVYTHGTTELNRQAHHRIVRMVISGKPQALEELVGR